MYEKHWHCRSVGVGFNFLVTNEAYIIYSSLLLFEGGLLGGGPAFQPIFRLLVVGWQVLTVDCRGVAVGDCC